ncbi:CpaD family pilus assembly protein [Sphingomonas lenta]|uniref:Pilus assembly protein CpaD n=1 Tax=Sphingomonas lenta TaxID=1141887 RepID=A0A2A2SJR0_9SPHN|nr:CpaD family pilus assembly protein [Sphingomonas lenta]PAX09463.1 pilus assembly protein CpaD [Sphingomonas lenta]
MIHAKSFLASAALLLAGCMGTQNRGLESVHQPVVQRSDYLLDLRAAGQGLAQGEQARLAGWFDALRLGYGDRVTVDDPSGTAPGARAEVAGVVEGYGLLLAGDAPVTPAPVAPGTVRVVVSRARASVPGCPDWSRDVTQNNDNHTSSGFGCATNANFAAMVANPVDLVNGRDGAESADPAISGRAINGYRTRSTGGSK